MGVEAEKLTCEHSRPSMPTRILAIPASSARSLFLRVCASFSNAKIALSAIEFSDSTMCLGGGQYEVHTAWHVPLPPATPTNAQVTAIIPHYHFEKIGSKQPFRCRAGVPVGKHARGFRERGGYTDQLTKTPDNHWRG